MNEYNAMIGSLMNVFKSATGTTDHSKAAMEMTAIATFNNQFAGYLNKNLTLSQCNTLIQKMIASNATNSIHKVYWGSSGSEDPTTAAAEAGTYKAVYDPNTGYITHIYKA